MIIYKITNKINGKIYIGQTKGTVEKRWTNHCCKTSHCSILHNAIVKYGKENFTVEVIDYAEDKPELDKKEIYWIKFYDSVAPKGYNISTGGNGNIGYKPSEETLEKRSKVLKGINLGDKNASKRPEVKKKMSEAAKKRIGSLSARGKQVRCIETGVIYPTTREASKEINCSYKNISAVCVGSRKSCGGFTWEYV